MDKEDKILSLLEKMQYDITGIKSEIGVLHRKNDMIIGTIAEMKEDITVMKEDIAVMKEDIAVMKEDIAVMKGDITTLQTDMTVVKEDITIIKEEITDNSLKIKIIDNKVKAL
ncbi:MAG: hypothetical protein GX434_14785 [Peptococcaceae bacterium]|nr:hypothetical protein [Peptococcaceae bacterium]